MSPSDLAWWIWLLIAAGAALVCTIAWGVHDDRVRRGFVSGLIVFLAGSIAVTSAFIGLIRFVKWVWVE